MSKTEPCESPVGTIEWAFIDGDGKEDMNGDKKYTIDVVVSPEQKDEFLAKIDAFWEANKPAGAKDYKSNGAAPIVTGKHQWYTSCHHSYLLCHHRQ